MILDASQTSVSVKAGNANSWYGSLTLAHQPNTVLSYSLTAGHEIRAGIQSDAIESYYVRPSMDWALIRHVTLHTSLFYEHGTLAGGQPTSLQEKGYDWYGGGLNLAYSPMKRVVIALNYRLTLRDSNEASREYAQNMVGLQITYTPQ